METGILILRVVVGLLLIGHGTQKLFGWFGGYGLSGTADYVESLGYRPGKPFALLNGLAETGGGLLIALGLGGPLGIAVVIGNMLSAYREHAGKGPWNDNGGWELPLVFGAVAASLGFTGFGSYALDEALGWDVAGNDWGAIALVAGLALWLGAHLASRLAASQPAVESHA